MFWYFRFSHLSNQMKWYFIFQSRRVMSLLMRLISVCGLTRTVLLTAPVCIHDHSKMSLSLQVAKPLV